MATAKKKTTKTPHKTAGSGKVASQEASTNPEASAVDYKILKLVAINKWFGLAYIIQAVMILFLSASRSVPVQTQYVTHDAMATADAGHGIVATATRNLFDVDLAYLVVAFLVIAAVTHLCIAYISTKQYADGVRQGVNQLRWLMFAGVGSFAMTSVALVAGMYSAMTLVLLISLVVVTMLLGWAIEIQGRIQAASSQFLWRLFLVTAGVPLIVIGSACISARVFGDALSAWVYAAFVLSVLSSAGIAALLRLQLRAQGRWADTTYVERIYLIGSLGINTALAWVLFAGALRS